MGNPRITKKEKGLIKGALRRVFSRSELRRKIIELYTVEHSDIRRPRVTKWGYCAECGEVIPRYLLQVDHMAPVVPLHLSLEEMGWETLVDRIWCQENNLQTLCLPCHKVKSKQEGKERRKAKKERK